VKKLVLVPLMIVLLTGLVLGGCAQPAPALAPAPTTTPAPAPAPTPMKVIELNYSSFMPPSEAHSDVANFWIAEVERRTNGRVKIAYYPSGSLVSPAQSYDGVVKGITDMDFCCAAYTPTRFPLTFAWNLPLGIASSTVATRIMNETFEKYKPEEFADTKVLYIVGSGPCELQVTKPVDTIEDFRGMKIRCTGIGAEWVEGLGGVPVAMPMSETYEALQKNVVEGTINAEGALHDYKFGELIKYEYLWHTYVVAFPLVMNLDKWHSLPPDIQKIFEEVSAESLPMEIDGWNDHDIRGRNFGLDNGMQVIEPTAEVREALEKASQPLYDKYVAETEAKGLPGREFLNDIMELIKKYQ